MNSVTESTTKSTCTYSHSSHEYIERDLNPLRNPQSVSVQPLFSFDFVLETDLAVALIKCYLPPTFAELENQESRVSEIHSLVYRLPEKNRQMLQLLMNHLAK